MSKSDLQNDVCGHYNEPYFAKGECKKCYYLRRKYDPVVQAQERNKRYQKRYGLDYVTIELILERQNNQCANPGCDGPADHVDHDHNTGAVRGILCFSCNTALGHLKDDPDRIAGLIHYLTDNLSNI